VCCRVRESYSHTISVRRFLGHRCSGAAGSINESHTYGPQGFLTYYSLILCPAISIRETLTALLTYTSLSCYR
jgi:hypothetical protein